MARPFVSHARTLRNRTVALSASSALLMTAFGRFSFMPMCLRAFGLTLSPPHHSSLTSALAVLVGTLHLIIFSSVHHPLMMSFISSAVSAILASLPLHLI